MVDIVSRLRSYASDLQGNPDENRAGGMNDPMVRVGLGVLQAAAAFLRKDQEIATAGTGLLGVANARYNPLIRYTDWGPDSGALSGRAWANRANQGFSQAQGSRYQRLLAANEAAASGGAPVNFGPIHTTSNALVTGGMNAITDPLNLTIAGGPLAEAGGGLGRVGRALEIADKLQALPFKPITYPLGKLVSPALRLGGQQLDWLTMPVREDLGTVLGRFAANPEAQAALRNQVVNRGGGAVVGGLTAGANSALYQSAQGEDPWSDDTLKAALAGAVAGGALGSDRMGQGLGEMLRLGTRPGFFERRALARGGEQAAGDIANLGAGIAPQSAGNLTDRLAARARQANLGRFMEGAHPLLLNEDGTPKMLFHGSLVGDIDQFRVPEKTGAFGRGAYFTEDPNYASMYASGQYRGSAGVDNAIPINEPQPNVKPVYVNLRNPYIWGSNPADDTVTGLEGLASREEIADRLARSGYDGVIVPKTRYGPDGNPVGQEVDELVAFDPATQVKSATGNNGTYDRNNPSLLASGLNPQAIRDMLGAAGRSLKPYIIGEDAAQDGRLARIFGGYPDELQAWLDSKGYDGVFSSAGRATANDILQAGEQVDLPFGSADDLLAEDLTPGGLGVSQQDADAAAQRVAQKRALRLQGVSPEVDEQAQAAAAAEYDNPYFVGRDPARDMDAFNRFGSDAREVYYGLGDDGYDEVVGPNGETGVKAAEALVMSAPPTADELSPTFGSGVQDYLDQSRPLLDQEERDYNLQQWHKGSSHWVTNPDGTPKTFYHGTGVGDFPQFNDPEHSTYYGRGVYLTEVLPVAEGYAEEAARSGKAGFGGNQRYGQMYENIKPVYVNVKNPYVLGSDPRLDAIIENSRWRNAQSFLGPDSTSVLEGLGYDGIVVRSDRGWQKASRIYGAPPESVNELIVFRAQNIKSATGNLGTFDPNQNSLLYSGLSPQSLQALLGKLTGEQRDRAANWDFQAGIGAERPVLSETPLFGKSGKPLMQKGVQKVEKNRLERGAEYIASILRQGAGGSGFPADPRIPVEVVGAARMMTRGVVDFGQWAAEMAQDYPNIFTSPEIARRLYDESGTMYARALQEVIDPAKMPSVARMADDIAQGLVREPRALDWYETTLEDLTPAFGQDVPVFIEMLAATSPNNNVPGNVTAALKAYTEWKLGYDVGELWSDPYHTQKLAKSGSLMFAHPGYLPAHIPNLEATFRGEPWGDVKVQDFLNSFYEPYYEGKVARGEKVPDFNLTYPGGVQRVPGAWARFRQTMKDFAEATAYTGDVWDLRKKGLQDVPDGQAWIDALEKMVRKGQGKSAKQADIELARVAQQALDTINENPESPLASGWAAGGTRLDEAGKPTTVGREAGIGVSALSSSGALTGERYRSGKEYLFNKALGQELATELTKRLKRRITPRQAQAGLWFAGKDEWERLGYIPKNDNLEGGPFTDYVVPQMRDFGGAEQGDPFVAGNLARAVPKRLATIVDTEFGRAARAHFGKLAKNDIATLRSRTAELLQPALDRIQSYGSALPPEGDPLGPRGVRPRDWDAIVPGYIYEEARRALEQAYPDPTVFKKNAPALEGAVDYQPRTFFNPEPYDVNAPTPAGLPKGEEFEGPIKFGAGLSPSAVASGLRNVGGGAAIGAGVGAAYGYQADDENPLRGAAKGALAGGIAGAVGQHLMPELGAAVAKGYRSAAPGIVDNTVLDPKALALAHEMAVKAMEVSRNVDGAKLADLPRAVDDAWRAQVVNTMRGLGLDAVSLRILVEDFGRDYGVTPATVKAVFGDLLAHAHDADPIDRLGRPGQFLKSWGLDRFVDKETGLERVIGSGFAGAESGARAAKLSGPQRVATGALLSFANLRDWVVPVGGTALSMARQYYAPYIDTAYRTLNGLQHSAPRLAFWTADLARQMPVAQNEFLDTLAKVGIDLPALRGVPTTRADFERQLAAKYKGLTPQEVSEFGQNYDDMLEAHAMKSADRVAHIFGDFRDEDAHPWKKFLARVFPFSRYALAYAPVWAEQVKRHPLIAGAAIAGLGASGLATLHNNEQPWNAGTVPISTETPLLGPLARARLGGESGTVRLDPIGQFTGPLGANLFSGMGDASTPYDQATSLLDKVGVSPHPVIGLLANLTGQSDQPVSPFSRTANVEQATELVPGMPTMPTLQGPFDRAKSLLTGQRVDDFDRVARRYGELYIEDKGQPMSTSGKALVNIGDVDDPLWRQARQEVKLADLIGNLLSLTTPLSSTGQTHANERYKQARATTLTDANIERAAGGDPLLLAQLGAAQRYAFQNNLPESPANPLLRTYQGASTAARDRELYPDTPAMYRIRGTRLADQLAAEYLATVKRKDR